MSIDLVNPHEFHAISSSLRDFFKSRNLVEVPVQHRLSILAACEDVQTISTFEYAGNVYPLPQTGQMWLEYELLNKYDLNGGYFCYSTSYRQELNPKPGRHNLIFPMIEFELPGNMDVLEHFETDLLMHIGYDWNSPFRVGWNRCFASGNYTDVAEIYGVKELEHEHEERMYQDYGPVFFLKHFPFTTSPFWNMKANFETKTANKIDVILSGCETIGSAERSCNPVEMRDMFNTISDGMYAKTLYSKFGKDRVERELDQFLSFDFKERCGGGIGVTRLIRSMKMEGLL
jgi:aspartyl/asparaginyl-tRNA synthetase